MKLSLAILRKLAEAGRDIKVRTSRSEAVGPVLYLCDVRTGHLRVLKLRPDAYRHPDIKWATRAIDSAEFCGGLCTVMEVMSGKPTLTEKLESLLVSMAALYVLGTETYKTTRGSNYSQHIIISYPPVHAEPRRALKMIPVVHHLPLNHCEIEEIVDQVLHGDRQLRPQWFPPGPAPRYVVIEPTLEHVSEGASSEWLPDGPARRH